MFSLDVSPWPGRFFEAIAPLSIDSGQDSALCCSAMSDLALEASFLFKEVDALCENIQARALFELKSCALKQLKPSGRATLFGLNPKGRRVFLFHQIK